MHWSYHGWLLLLQAEWHSPLLPSYIDIPTRLDRTLDLCYGNIESAFTAKSWAPLGSADDNMYFFPKYPQLLKRLKPTTVTIQRWTDDTTAHLQVSLACTGWDILMSGSSNKIDEMVTTITDYIKFCIHCDPHENHLDISERQTMD